MINNLNRTIEKIHNYIYANDGLDNYEVLDALLKIFYIKTYDEMNSGVISSSSSEKEIIKNVETIFGEIVSKYPNLFEKNAKIGLKNETLLYVMKVLKDISISKESSDVKGHLMQRIIDRSFREGRGQFFTPAQVVEFIVKMVEPKAGQRGCDPACGTGGFMFTALEEMSKGKKNIGEIVNDVDFFDISKSVVKLISMRLMFEFAIDNPNIKIQDSISNDIPAIYDFVLTNPPFGSQGRISDKNILAKYSLGHDESGKVYSSQVPDILFVEKVVNILKDGGKGAVVLPDGNFENPSSQYFREYLFRNTKVDAVISLPDGTFIPYGTGVKSSIIFFTKESAPDLDYEVFFGKINNLGYTFSKHSKPLLDKSGNIIEDYSHVIDAYKNKNYDEENFIVSAKDIVKNNFSLAYHYYCPKINNLIKSLVGESKIKLDDLVTVQGKRFKIDPDTMYRYVEISDVSATGCEIINCSELEGSDLPSRASFMLKENQIIVAIAGNAIGSVWNTKAIVTKEYEGCICTNGFIVLDAKNVSPYLLLHFFNTEAFRAQVRKYRYGTAIPTISRDDFLSMIVPDYTNEEKDKIINNMKKAFELKAEVKKLLLMED